MPYRDELATIGDVVHGVEFRDEDVEAEIVMEHEPIRLEEVGVQVDRLENRLRSVPRHVRAFDRDPLTNGYVSEEARREDRDEGDTPRRCHAGTVDQQPPETRFGTAARGSVLERVPVSIVIAWPRCPTARRRTRSWRPGRRARSPR
jgi:hypothetical protein